MGRIVSHFNNLCRGVLAHLLSPCDTNLTDQKEACFFFGLTRPFVVLMASSVARRSGIVRLGKFPVGVLSAYFFADGGFQKV